MGFIIKNPVLIGFLFEISFNVHCLAGVINSSISASASVPSECKVSVATLNFGNYSPIGANASTPLRAVGLASVYCTKGAIITITFDSGQNSSSAQGTTRAMVCSNQSRYLSYELYRNLAYSQILGSLGPLTSASSLTNYGGYVYAEIPPGQATIPVGSYHDNVSLTVNF